MKPFRKSRNFFLRASVLFLILSLVFPLPSFALFGKKAKIPSASQMAAELENRYHINTKSVQNFGEEFNVSSQKAATPEVSIFFSPADPKPGEKITAKAYPLYFSNPTENLYFTWYLKRAECDKDGNVNNDSGDSENDNYCDKSTISSGGNVTGWGLGDGDGDIDEEDWKIAAIRTVFEQERNTIPDYTQSSSDDDRYNATFGGDKREDQASWCYIKDSQSGTLYELADSTTNSSISCANAAHTPVCLTHTQFAEPTEIVINNMNCDGFGNCSGGGGGGDTFDVSEGYIVTGTPSCNINKTAECPSDSVAACKATSSTGIYTDTASQSALSCTTGDAKNGCVHLFPRVGLTGKGDYLTSEEKFWGSDHRDPDSADLGLKDEALVVGVGRDTFTWNYQPGDKVGVAVEGVSMIPTKHDDSSNMIMWAFSKNQCDIKSDKKGSYTKGIRGYTVTIPTVKNMDLNDCLEENLIDPTEGGQAKKLDVSVTYSPDNPVNDQTNEKGGDILTAYATVNNSIRPSNEIFYDWKVEINKQSSGGSWKDITEDLLNEGLISSMKGNGISSFPIALNMDDGFLDTLAGADPFYLRITAFVTENFDSAASRSGKSDVIVRVSNTTKKIVAYSTKVVGGKVETDRPICNEFFPNPANEAQVKANLDRVSCRVAKNEIIGIFVNSSDLSNYQWTINGTPLNCTKENVSSQCADQADGKQNNYAFFAATGNSGDTYTVQLTANDITTGKSVTLSRTFLVADPEVTIGVADVNNDGSYDTQDWVNQWPVFLGTYTDLSGATYDDYSEIAFETYNGNNVRLEAKSIPGWVLGAMEGSRVWYLDGNPIVVNGVPVDSNSGITVHNSEGTDITLPATLVSVTAGDIHNISFTAEFIQSNDKRSALEKIWGISALESTEMTDTTAIQLTVIEFEDIAKSGAQKFYAAVSEYIPSSVVLSLRLMLTIGLLIFTMSFIFSLIPETSGEEVILSRRIRNSE